MLMRRRLYFVLPDIESARTMLNEMLLARIEVRHIHFLAKRDALPDDLPEANVLQKTDIVHGAQMGIGIGAVVGAVAGALVVLFPPTGITLKFITVLIVAIGGAFFGAWASSMVASSVPNSRLKAFRARHRERQSADDGRRADRAGKGNLRARIAAPSRSAVRRLRTDDTRVPVKKKNEGGGKGVPRPRFSAG